MKVDDRTWRAVWKVKKKPVVTETSKPVSANEPMKAVFDRQ